MKNYNIILLYKIKLEEIDMKKTFLALSALLLINSAALADGNAFTPLDFNDTSYSAPKAAATSMKTSNTLSSGSTVLDEAVGNGNIQNAIQQLDNAQIDMRNELLNYKTKFADVDAQYKLVKSERASLKSQIRACERRIKDLDSAKEKIRKNML